MPRMYPMEIQEVPESFLDVALSTRKEFIDALTNALENRVGFAAGKLGYSEQVWLSSQWLLRQNTDNAKFQKAIRVSSMFHACQQAGAFPATHDYLDSAVQQLTEAVRGMDFLAIHDSGLVPGIIHHLRLKSGLLPFNDLEPNKDTPYNLKDCYLPALRDKRVLIVSTPADLLVSRATKVTFENTWQKISCPWFEPHSVEALSFDSLFDSEITRSYASSTDLLESICAELSTRNFDIALIGASSLGILIADYVKDLGKVGLSLGGHLQVIFGVQGKRWRENPHWQQAYWNESWVNMPENFKPTGRKWLVDDGAYW